MKILILSLLFLTSFNPIKPAEDAGCLMLDIILVGDVSASVGNDIVFIAEAFDTFINKFELSEEGIKISIITFETEVKILTSLTSDKGKLNEAVTKLKENGVGLSTNLTDALYIASNELVANGRDDVMKILIVITDGDPSEKESAQNVAFELKNIMSVGICGVLINNVASNSDFLKGISSEFCYVESHYENLVDELNKLDICL